MISFCSKCENDEQIVFHSFILDISERLHVSNFAVLKIRAKVRAVWAVSPGQPGSREITPRESIESRGFPRLPGIPGSRDQPHFRDSPEEAQTTRTYHEGIARLCVFPLNV